jgi:hypothetical protein
MKQFYSSWTPELYGTEEGGCEGPLDKYIEGHHDLGHHVAQRVKCVCSSKKLQYPKQICLQKVVQKIPHF